MNMFKPTSAKTPKQYIDMLEEPRKSEISSIHTFIQKHAPKLKPYIQHGMIGYGKMPYETKTGRKGDWFVLGLASQKRYISIYSCVIKSGEYLAETYKDKLGKASIGKSCVRYRNVDDIPWNELKNFVKDSEKIALSEGIFASEIYV